MGPEAITAGSSPGTSEMANVTTSAGQAAAARRPPVMAERCLRTQLTSPIGAPDLEQLGVHQPQVLEVETGGGEGEEGRTSAAEEDEYEVVGREVFDERQRALRGARAGGVRERMSGFDHVDRTAGDSVPVAGDRETR